MYQRIFVPVDDSSTSRRALDEAIKLAQHTGATLLLAHVVDLAQFGWGGTEFLDASELQKNIKATGEAVLNQAREAVEAAGLPCSAVLLESWGDKMAEVLVGEAEKEQAELIVMGTHGFSGLMHLLMGSVAEGIMRRANVPVLLVRSDETPDADAPPPASRSAPRKPKSWA